MPRPGPLWVLALKGGEGLTYPDWNDGKSLAIPPLIVAMLVSARAELVVAARGMCWWECQAPGKAARA